MDAGDGAMACDRWIRYAGSLRLRRPACLSTQRRRCPLLGRSMVFGPESQGDGAWWAMVQWAALSCIRDGCSWRMQLRRRTPYAADGRLSIRALCRYSRFFTLPTVPAPGQWSWRVRARRRSSGSARPSTPFQSMLIGCAVEMYWSVLTCPPLQSGRCARMT
ncbi:hypothetical protein B0H14DRAFT_1328932 [Mycena olivaceomarginata]|nr:hypothetical protein B0H14DRAFT_1328932 [Mycena olivaceomarginata]